MARLKKSARTRPPAAPGEERPAGLRRGGPKALLREFGWIPRLRHWGERVGVLAPNLRAPKHFEPGLGVNGLPQGVGLLPLQAPVALLIRDPAQPHAALRAVLQDSLRAGPVVLLGMQADGLDGLLAEPALQEALGQGRLRVWTISPGVGQDMARRGLEALLPSLRRQRLADDAALFVVGDAALPAQAAIRELQRLGRQWQSWCTGRRRPVVLVFPGSTGGDDPLSRLRALGGSVRHIAVMRRDEDRLGLYLERWDGPQGAVFQTLYGIAPDALDGRPAYDGRQVVGPGQEVVEAPDQYDVIATADAVAGQRGVPGHWKRVAGLEDMPAAAQRSVAATLLIGIGGMDQFEPVARLVHELRLSHPKSLKIVLRETGGKLRTNSEQALLRLGANAVVYREVGFSRLLQTLQETARQSFTDPVPADFEEALRGFVPEPIYGYRPAPRFCEAVQKMLQRSRDIGLRHSLVRLPVLPDVPHLDAIRAFNARRDGDLLTAAEDSLYVFLFACREPDVEASLTRLFTVPVTQLFSSQISDSSPDGVAALLEPLARAARRGLPDYSVHLPPLPSAPSRRAPEEEPAPPARGDGGPPGPDHPAPEPAHGRPGPSPQELAPPPGPGEPLQVTARPIPRRTRVST